MNVPDDNAEIEAFDLDDNGTFPGTYHRCRCWVGSIRMNKQPYEKPGVKYRYSLNYVHNWIDRLKKEWQIITPIVDTILDIYPNPESYIAAMRQKDARR